MKITVTAVGEFIRYNSCERRFKLVTDSKMSESIPFWDRLRNPLDIVLTQTGKDKEKSWKQALDKSKFSEIEGEQNEHGNYVTSWKKFSDAIGKSSDGMLQYAREVEITGTIGAFEFRGQIDFLLIFWKNQEIVLRIVECKASRKIATYQNAQVAIYKILVEQLLLADNIHLSNIECVVARIDEDSNQIQDILKLQPLDVSRETSDIKRLLENGGKLDKITEVDLGNLPFQIEPKCDSCIFNIHCLSESARERRLEILGINNATVRALNDRGIKNVYDLANLDLQSKVIQELRNDNNINIRIETLIQKARARYKNLPSENSDAIEDIYEVNSLNQRVESQLPVYDQNGTPLVRVYMNVTLDYVEKRIVALTAHVTKSFNELETGVVFNDNIPEFLTDVCEINETGESTPLQGELINEVILTEWEHKYEIDSTTETNLIRKFIDSLYKAIKKVADVGRDGKAPIHFYFWSRQELKNLIEACSRSTDQKLLHHLQQLMGCRESLEQLIYSCVQDEIRRRYALGWTGLGLSVVTSLKWYGKRYHWVRKVDGQEIQLDKVFTQDIFDFKTDLWVTPENEWADPNLPPNEQLRNGNRKFKFEIRSRFNDGLTPPYFYAYWDALPKESKITGDVKNIIERYDNAKEYLEDYLEARVYALRWIEERVKIKNNDIIKIPLTLNSLKSFDLEINTVARASIDYLHLDHHVKFTDWLASNFEPPIDRAATGKTLMLRQVSIKDNSIHAIIDNESQNATLESILEKATSFEEGVFVRMTPYFDDSSISQNRGQFTKLGKTCTIDRIDETTGDIWLSIIPYTNNDRYILKSYGGNDQFEFATLDESISDFIAGKVDARLSDITSSPAYNWLTPLNSEILIPEKSLQVDIDEIKVGLESLVLANGYSLSSDQLEAILSGLQAKIQLLQGPPGTGKSTTTSIAILTRILSSLKNGDIVFVSANTHLAVNSLLSKIDEDIDSFNSCLLKNKFSELSLKLIKLHTTNINTEDSVGGRVIDESAAKLGVRTIEKYIEGKVLIIGGTTSSLLKFFQKITNSAKFTSLTTKLLVIDEASMLVFPHFLALATLVDKDGDIMLAGDHRQLSPIIAHDWENEDRPPVILYKPFVSAYQAVWDIRQQIDKDVISEKSLVISQLTHTFRLPYEVVRLIARLYSKDNIRLQGKDKIEDTPNWDSIEKPVWEKLWHTKEGVFLITHNEKLSKKSNEIEIQIIEKVMQASGSLPVASTAIITPHRAQRTLLKKRLADYEEVIDIIETVEKLQGGERDNIIVSATASDPSAITNYTDFILNLNRANVAFSRPKERLIVVCSEELLNYIPADNEQYETAMLWKELRDYCFQNLGSESFNGNDYSYKISFFSSC